ARERWVRAAHGALLLTIAVGYVAWEAGRLRVLADYYRNPARPHGAMLRYFRERGAPRSMAVLSSGHSLAFPLALEVGARYGLRIPSLWPILTQYDLRDAARRGALPISAPHDAAHGVDSLLITMVAHDLGRCAPELLIVPEPRDTLVPNAATHAFDYVRYFGADARTAPIIAAYREVARVPDYVILERGGAPMACDAAAPPSSR
ncbi:MAG TPA: hypothetical protein VFX50_02845, partial [Gemmatimonadales bacterium]|nr:hypothetical protein [Gemmatimonadales bacterium]